MMAELKFAAKMVDLIKQIFTFLYETQLKVHTKQVDRLKTRLQILEKHLQSIVCSEEEPDHLKHILLKLQNNLEEALELLKHLEGMDWLKRVIEKVAVDSKFERLNKDITDYIQLLSLAYTTDSHARIKTLNAETMNISEVLHSLKDDTECIRKEIKAITKSDKSECRKIVLLGKTGAGKSAVGNIIVNKDIFKSGFCGDSITRECQSEETVVSETLVYVIDTPGVFDTKLKKKEVNKLVSKSMDLCLQGTHAFLLVFKFGDRFTEEEKNATIWMKDNFGKGALEYTIITFTCTTELKSEDIEKYINSCQPLKTLIDSCHGRYHICNIQERVDSQISQLLEKVNEICRANRGELYSLKMHKIAQTHMKIEDMIDCGLTVTATAGSIAAVAGAAALGVTELAAIPIAAGSTMIAGGAIKMASKCIRKKLESDKMKKMFEDKKTE